MANWFYGKDGIQHGPVSEQKIKDLLFSNEINDSTIVWREGMDDWIPLKQVPEFKFSYPSNQLDHPTQQNTPPPLPAALPTVPPTPSIASPSPIYAPGQATPPPTFVQPTPTSGLAIASLVCGIFTILACYFWGFFGIPAVICGHLALKSIKANPTPIQGKGMAIAGLILGYLGIILQLIVIAVGITMYSNAKEHLKNLEKEMQNPQNWEETSPATGPTLDQNSENTTPEPATSEF